VVQVIEPRGGGRDNEPARASRVQGHNVIRAVARLS
jgi:hypothetical protein